MTMRFAEGVQVFVNSPTIGMFYAHYVGWCRLKGVGYDIVIGFSGEKVYHVEEKYVTLAKKPEPFQVPGRLSRGP